VFSAGQDAGSANKDTDITDLSDAELVWLRGERQEELDGILSGERICYAPWDNGAYYDTSNPTSFSRNKTPGCIAGSPKTPG
jgi:hypothetical protein